jgi:hypothetical protein
LSAVFKLAHFGIGTYEPDEINVILVHRKFSPFVSPALPGAPGERGGRS